MFLESAEIVSIDAFNRPEPNKGLVVGISLILLKVQKPFFILGDVTVFLDKQTENNAK